jgi:hypothetical protein
VRDLTPVVIFVAVLSLSCIVDAQTIRTGVNCADERLSGAEREMCASPELTRLAESVDRLTAQLESTMTGREREALIDTERPVVVERNDCQNEPRAATVPQSEQTGVRDCITAVLQRRLHGLTQAQATPSLILDEVPRYSFLDVPFVAKWGALLTGRRVRIFGCLVIDPGWTVGTRPTMTLRESCSATSEPNILVPYGVVNEESVEWVKRAEGVIAHWVGTIEGGTGQVVLGHLSLRP